MESTSVSLWGQRRSMIRAQAGFVVLLLADTAVTVSQSEEIRSLGILLLTHALAVLALVGLCVGERVRAPDAVIGLLPVLDLAALGLVRIAIPGTGADLLCVIPALWLAWELSYRGALIGTIGAASLMSLPWMVVLGPVDGNAAGAILTPFVVLLVGTVMAWLMEHLQESHRASVVEQSSRQAAVREADRHRRFNEAILDTVDVGLVLLDAEGRYLMVNERHRDFIDLAFPDGHEGVAGQLGHVFGFDSTTPLTREEMPTSRAARGEEFDDALMWVGEDPLHRRALSVSARTVHDAEGRSSGVALAYTDVTDFMRALAVKDDFVAMVSHELRTPLTSIRGYTALLLDELELDPVLRKHLTAVERNAARLERLVGDLLHTAQAARGALQVVRRPADLAGIVRESARAVGGRAADAGVHLEVKTPASLPMLADSERMGQVVDNLVTNAVKYSPDGGRVEVTLVEEGDHAVLSVVDQGIGIDAADRELLFTRFFRAREAAQREIQGVGLGLSITKQIVEGHGGRITVESDLGRGSTFWVRLPLAGARVSDELVS